MLSECRSGFVAVSRHISHCYKLRIIFRYLAQKPLLHWAQSSVITTIKRTLKNLN